MRTSITLAQVTGGHDADSPLVADLARTFREARKDRLAFLLNLHGQEEDRNYLSNTVLPNNQVWLARADDTLAGFIAFHDGWVNHLYVAPRFQRQGIGAQLLALAKQANPALQLWVFQVNRPAIQFYRREGFQIAEQTTGANNEANKPDVRMVWQGRTFT